MGRGVDRVDLDPLGYAPGRHVLPVLPAVARDVDEAVVGPRPDHPGLERRLRDREDRVVDIDPDVVFGDRPAVVSLLGRIIAGQVGADLFPGLTLVAALEQLLRGVVEDLRIVYRDGERSVPVEPIPKLARRLPRLKLRPRGDVALLPRVMVVAGDQTEVVARIDDLRVLRVGRDPAGLTAPD